MKVSINGYNMIAKWEGFRENAYLDSASVPTIGYGTINYNYGLQGMSRKPVKIGDKISQTEAWKIFLRQVDAHATTIKKYIKVPLNQNQFDALASFQYNLGADILATSGKQLAKYINEKKWENAVAEMEKFNKARVNGVLKEIKGLTNRRKYEASLFLKPVKEDEITGKFRVELKTGVFNKESHANEFIEKIRAMVYVADVKVTKE